MQSLQAQKNKAQEALAKAQRQVEILEQVTGTSIVAEAAITKVLEKNHLEGIEIQSYLQGGCFRDDNEGPVKLHLALRAKPVGAKGEKWFVGFAGYTAQGAGKNQKRLEAKAEKLKQLILAELSTKITTDVSVGVNQYSMEFGGSSKRNWDETAADGRAMISVWVTL